jgi:hypothetical protein
MKAYVICKQVVVSLRHTSILRFATVLVRVLVIAVGLPASHISRGRRRKKNCNPRQLRFGHHQVHIIPLTQDFQNMHRHQVRDEKKNLMRNSALRIRTQAIAYVFMYPIPGIRAKGVVCRGQPNSQPKYSRTSRKRTPPTYKLRRVRGQSSRVPDKLHAIIRPP